MKFLPAFAALMAFGAASGVAQAAGQPKLDSQESAAVTSGKTSDQAANSKMEVKQERDTQKYQDKENQTDPKASDKLAGAESTAPGYETTSAVDGSAKSSGNAATGQSGGKRPPP